MSHDLKPSLLADVNDTSTDTLVATVVRFMRIIHFRKQVIISTLTVSAILGTAYYLTATRMFQSTAKLLVIQQKQDQLSTVGDSDSSDNTMATHCELLTSPVVLLQAIKHLAPEHRIDFHGTHPRDWAKVLSSQLVVRSTRKTNIIEVSYRSKHPLAAAAIVRQIVDAYLAFVAKTHQGTAGDVLRVLVAQAGDVESKLLLKQQELQQFSTAVGHLTTGNDEQIAEPEIQKAMKLHESLLVAQERSLELRATLQAVDEAIARGDDVNQYVLGIEETVGRQILLNSLGLSPDDMRLVTDQQDKLLAEESELKRLSAFFGPNHPQIAECQEKIASYQQFLEAQRHRLGAGVDSLTANQLGPLVRKLLAQGVQQAAEKERQLAASFEQARAEATKHSGALLHLRTLESEVARLEAQYDVMFEQIASVDQRQSQAPIQVTVIKEPFPEQKPVSPQLRMIGLLCLVCGFVFGGLIAYLQDILDDRFTSPEEISAQLGVSILAMVRKLEPLPGVGLETVHTFSLPHAVETEAFRTLRTSISLGENVCERILISSSEPGDGKTTISANLSVALAQAGKRTLVIDADLRRPGFSTLLKLKGQQGVADILTSPLPPSETAPPLVHHTEVPGLDVIPVGFRRPNPSELLGSNAFVELLAWADSCYDRVIVDCPPVLAVSDAQIVGQLVDGAILVVRPEKNHRRSVIRAVDCFRTAGCRVLGIVANGLSNASSGYGYGYGYGYEYGYGYDEEELADYEPSESTPLAISRGRSTNRAARVGHPTPQSQTGIKPRRAA
ncbi:MAG: polysaccharide biosynthesis tyrosine autokinase [Bythopirellula sp.]|nr:polysaccharide biosynthesis tyrosine autokinase [Bythopirellula sp.]